jgi:hypothetical protein
MKYIVRLYNNAWLGIGAAFAGELGPDHSELDLIVDSQGEELRRIRSYLLTAA